MTNKVPKTISTILSLFLISFLTFTLFSSSVFAAAGPDGPHVACGGKKKCYAWQTAITWIKVQYPRIGPGQKLWYSKGKVQKAYINEKCGEYGFVYILVPFWHTSAGFPYIINETGPRESLTNGLYSPSAIYLSPYGAAASIDGIKALSPEDPYYKWQTADHGVAGGAKFNSSGLPGLGGGSIVEFGAKLEDVKRMFDSMPPDAKKDETGRSYTWDSASNLSYFCYGPTGDELKSKAYVKLNDTNAQALTSYDSEDANISSSLEQDETGTAKLSINFKQFMFKPKNFEDAKAAQLDAQYRIVYTEEVGGTVIRSNVVKDYSRLNFTDPGWVTEGTGAEEIKKLMVYEENREEPLPAQLQTKKYCERIDYNLKYYKDLGPMYTNDVQKNGGKNFYSKACVTVSVPPTPLPKVCPKQDWNKNYGNSYGESNVVRARPATANSPNKATAKDETPRTIRQAVVEPEPIYGRPGDNIRFDHCISTGAQAVTGNFRYGDPRVEIAKPANTGTQFPKKKLEKTEFTINADPTGKHAFGRRTIVYGSPTVKLKDFEYSPLLRGGIYPVAESSGHNKKNNTVLDADKLGASSFMVYSPSTSWRNEDKPTKTNPDRNIYKCDYGDFGANVPFNYQISGLDSEAKCARAESTQRSDVGQIIKQHLNYKNVYAWVREYHQIPGSCGSLTGYCDGSSCCGPRKDAKCYCQGKNKTKYDRWWDNYWYAGYPGQEIYGVVSDGSQTNKNEWPGCQNRGSAGESAGGCGRCCRGHTSCSGSGTNRTCSYVCDDYDSHRGDSCSYNPGEAAGNGGRHGGRSGIWVNKDYTATRYYTEQMSNMERRTVAVKVPYNYITETKSNISDGTSIFLGETVSSSFVWTIKPRINQKVIEETYATITPDDSRVEIVEFLVDSKAGPNVEGDINAATSGPCKYYADKFGESFMRCNILETIPGPFNGDGRYRGETYSRGYTRAVPDLEDVEVGSKYCVAIGFFRTDSWGDPKLEKITAKGHNDGKSLSGASDKWNISGASCRTISKKPNFQVWGEGIYTNLARTAVSKKRVNVDLGKKSTHPEDGVSGDASSSIPFRNFGSWTEYEIIAVSGISGIASGAAIGYDPHEFNLMGGIYATRDYCRFSIMTIRGCSGSTAGRSGINIWSGKIINQFLARYFPDGGATHSGSVSSDIRTARRLDNANHPEAESDTKYVKYSGDVSTGGKIIRKANDGTLVIAVQGTLTITDNICIGYGTCADGNEDELILGDREDKGGTYGRNVTNFNNNGSTDITVLPQVIIITDGVNITQNVTQVDAWIITDELDTCSDAGGDQSVDSCNKTVIFNGPVISHNLYLNRTAGATAGGGEYEYGRRSVGQNLSNDGSITPAEIFNYRPDAMFWAYNQAQRFSQATVTYSRELAPRL